MKNTYFYSSLKCLVILTLATLVANNIASAERKSDQSKNDSKLAKADVNSTYALRAAFLIGHIKNKQDLIDMMKKKPESAKLLQRELKDVSFATPQVAMPSSTSVVFEIDQEQTRLSFDRATENILMVNDHALRVGGERTLIEYLNELRMIQNKKSKTSRLDLFIDSAHAADPSGSSIYEQARAVVTAVVGDILWQVHEPMVYRASFPLSLSGYRFGKTHAEHILGLMNDEFARRKTTTAPAYAYQAIRFTCRGNELDTMVLAPIFRRGKFASADQATICDSQSPCLTKLTKLSSSEHKYRWSNSSCVTEIDEAGQVKKIVSRSSVNLASLQELCPKVNDNVFSDRRYSSSFYRFHEKANACCSEVGCATAVEEGLAKMVRSLNPPQPTANGEPGPINPSAQPAQL